MALPDADAATGRCGIPERAGAVSHREHGMGDGLACRTAARGRWAEFRMAAGLAESVDDYVAPGWRAGPRLLPAADAARRRRGAPEVLPPRRAVMRNGRTAQRPLHGRERRRARRGSAPPSGGPVMAIRWRLPFAWALLIEMLVLWPHPPSLPEAWSFTRVYDNGVHAGPLRRAGLLVCAGAGAGSASGVDRPSATPHLECSRVGGSNFIPSRSDGLGDFLAMPPGPHSRRRIHRVGAEARRFSR